MRMRLVRCDDRGEEHLGRRGVRELGQEVVLDLPHGVEAEPVGELDLLERLVVAAVLAALVVRLRRLQLVEEVELHRPGGMRVSAAGARSRRGARRLHRMAEFALPRSDEPFDFRHQAVDLRPLPARLLGRALRRDRGAHRARRPGGSPSTSAAGRASSRRASSHRGWRVIGVDFSAPMLAEARVAGRRHAPPRARARRGASAARRRGVARHLWHLVPLAGACCRHSRSSAACSRRAAGWRSSGATPRAASRRSGWWRRCSRGSASRCRTCSRNSASTLPTRSRARGSSGEPPLLLHTVLSFTVEEFHGYVSTLEWIRRFAGTNHAAFLDRLGEELSAHHPDGFEERNEEHLFLARRPA